MRRAFSSVSLAKSGANRAMFCSIIDFRIRPLSAVCGSPREVQDVFQSPPVRTIRDDPAARTAGSSYAALGTKGCLGVERRRHRLGTRAHSTGRLPPHLFYRGLDVALAPVQVDGHPVQRA